MLRWEMIIFC